MDLKPCKEFLKRWSFKLGFNSTSKKIRTKQTEKETAEGKVDDLVNIGRYVILKFQMGGGVLWRQKG